MGECSAQEALVVVEVKVEVEVAPVLPREVVVVVIATEERRIWAVVAAAACERRRGSRAGRRVSFWNVNQWWLVRRDESLLEVRDRSYGSHGVLLIWKSNVLTCVCVWNSGGTVQYIVPG